MAKRKYFVSFIFGLLVFVFGVYGDIPEGYYRSAENLSGDQLKAALNDIIQDNVKFSYSEVWEVLKFTDEDPDNSANVKLLYSGWSYSKNNKGGGASQWNREHVWAKSHGDFGTSKGPGTDVHHLRPTDVTVNSARGNLEFDLGGDIYTDGDGPTQCKRVNGLSWEPWDEVKGDVARMLFYMAVRYEGEDGDVDLELSENMDNGKNPRHGKLSTLLKWHQEDPVSDWERRRNDRIFEKQKNRNPFIDHPEWVAKIWGGEGIVPTTDWTEKTNSISTPHDYPTAFRKVWLVRHPGASSLKVFFSKFDTEKKYDTVDIYDMNGNLIQQLDGNREAFWSETVSGDTMVIVFYADYNINKYGFDITKYAFK